MIKIIRNIMPYYSREKRSIWLFLVLFGGSLAVLGASILPKYSSGRGLSSNFGSAHGSNNQPIINASFIQPQPTAPGAFPLHAVVGVSPAGNQISLNNSQQRVTQGKITLSSKLTQTKVIQGSTEDIYMDIRIETGADDTPKSKRKSMDMVVVLDTSGSMSAKGKMEYAKEAVRQLMEQLNSDDRLSLVSFSSSASIVAHHLLGE
ncbi:MAG: VWA domain-containing protein [Planctomycetes bacterium]|nr:VWA domain-containing protein [Planctomycetota bacterium]